MKTGKKTYDVKIITQDRNGRVNGFEIYPCADLDAARDRFNQYDGDESGLIKSVSILENDPRTKTTKVLEIHLFPINNYFSDGMYVSISPAYLNSPAEEKLVYRVYNIDERRETALIYIKSDGRVFGDAESVGLEMIYPRFDVCLDELKNAANENK